MARAQARRTVLRLFRRGHVRKHPERKEKEEEEEFFTKLIKLRVDSRRAGDRTDQPGFEEGGPAVDETPPPAEIVLD